MPAIQYEWDIVVAGGRPLLITHWGMSGLVVLRVSAWGLVSCMRKIPGQIDCEQ